MGAAPRWRFAATSVTGTSHVRSGGGCQDSYATHVFDALEGPVLIVAVSDGAGSARAGAVGSALATGCVIEQAVAWLISGRRVGDIDVATARDWLNGIREHIAEKAGEAESEMRDFAATLLFAVVSQTHSVFVQLGDGAIVVLTPEHEWSWVFWPMHGEYANTTYFVTDDAAAKNLQFEARPRPVREIAAFTDGLEPLVLEFKTKSAFQPFFGRMFRPLRASTVAGRDEQLSAQLTAYLRSPVITAKADDDLTLVMATTVDEAPIQPAQKAPHLTEMSDGRDGKPDN